MANEIGNQGGFEQFAQSTTELRTGIKMFGASVGTWAAGVYAFRKAVQDGPFKDLVEKLTGQEFSLSLRDVLRKGIPLLGIKSLVDTMSELVSVIYNLRKNLSRELGLGGGLRDQVQSGLEQQIQTGLAFIISADKIYDAYKALYEEFRNFESPLESENLVAMTAAASERFQIGMADAAKFTAGLERFQGFSSRETKAMLDEFESMDVSTALIGEQLAGASKHMYKLNISSTRAEDRFKRMVGFTSKLGLNLGAVLDATDKFRDFGTAMEGSMLFSRWGMSVTPTELMSGAITGDIGPLLERTISKLGAQTDAEGNLTNVGVRMADEIGGQLGLDRMELINAVMRAREDGVAASVSSTQDFMKEMRDARNIRDRFQNAVEKFLFSAAVPFMKVATPALEFMEKHAGVIVGLLGAILGVLTLSKMYHKAMAAKTLWQATAGQEFKWGNFFDTTRGTGKGNKGGFGPNAGKWRRIKRFLGASGGGALSSADVGGFGERSSGMRGGVLPTSAPTPTAAPPKVGPAAQPAGKVLSRFPAASQLLAGGAAILMFAGAVLILAHAFKKFGEVDWERAKWGGVVIAGTIASIAVLAGIAKVAAPAMMIGTGVFIAFSFGVTMLAGAMDTFATAVKKMDGVDLSGIGGDLAALAGGMMAIGGLSLIGGPLGLAAIGLGAFTASKVISTLGEQAIKYADPLSQLASAMEILADSLERVVKLSEGVAQLNLDALAGSVNKLSTPTGTSSKGTPIQNHIRIDIDGKKLFSAMEETMARESVGA